MSICITFACLLMLFWPSPAVFGISAQDTEDQLSSFPKDPGSSHEFPGTNFPEDLLLEIHRKKHPHPAQVQFKCGYCGKDAKNSRDVIRHIYFLIHPAQAVRKAKGEPDQLMSIMDVNGDVDDMPDAEGEFTMGYANVTKGTNDGSFTICGSYR